MIPARAMQFHEQPGLEVLQKVCKVLKTENKSFEEVGMYNALRGFGFLVCSVGF